MVGCNQEETVKAKTLQKEHIEEISFTVKERESEEYKSTKEIVKSDEIKTVLRGCLCN
ncbi:hypothetical protein [Ureibacillus sp. GCM10028918]|uniref:hypothetical protein n=1 Tax=Ureibacillus sp. GCM10028918 TaxID=3273429 RepID=UPI003605AE2C